MASNFGSVIIEDPKCFFDSSRYILLLSHMRSRSTVLSHILGSNVDIAGYRELHHSYRKQIDFLKMKADLYQDFKSEIKGKWLLDKILHNNHMISDAILHAENTRIVFLVREPENSIKSIIKMAKKNQIQMFIHPEQATNYYCERLAELTIYARSLGDRFFFVESDALVSEAETLLGQLKIWLGLNEDLSSTYKTFNHTGSAIAGDPSNNIRRGELIFTKGHPDITIPNELLSKALKMYEECVEIMSGNA